jgi:hypothetical protein
MPAGILFPSILRYTARAINVTSLKPYTDPRTISQNGYGIVGFIDTNIHVYTVLYYRKGWI